MINNKYISLAVIASLVLAVPVFAQTATNTSPSIELRDGRGGMMNWGRMMMGMHFGVIGTVTSVNDTTKTIIVTSNKIGWSRDGKDEDNQDRNTLKITPTPIVYTVDASNAKVIKAGVASTVAGIAVGDMVIVQGTVTGTNIVATVIRDGVNKDKDKDKDKDKETKTPKPEATPLILGNGQPIIAGVITEKVGTTLTITNKSNVTYTVDASTAKIQNKGALSTLSTVVVGDNVVIQGTVNGTSVTAYSVIDQGSMSNPSPSVKPNDKEVRNNFFNGIGKFFQRLFGF